MRLKRVGVLVVSCGMLGGLAAIATYLTFDFTPFGGDVIDPGSTHFRPTPEFGARLVPLFGQRLALMPDVLVGFLLTRLPCLLAQAVLLLLCVARRQRSMILPLSFGVPLFYEVVLAFSRFDGSWLGMLWALAINWRTPPEYVVPFHLAIRVAGAYLLPVLATGLGGWLLASSYLRGQRTPSSSSRLTPGAA
jgi:hypothetical protein